LPTRVRDCAEHAKNLSGTTFETRTLVLVATASRLPRIILVLVAASTSGRMRRTVEENSCLTS
jgi:hypothetical protein